MNHRFRGFPFGLFESSNIGESEMDLNTHFPSTIVESMNKAAASWNSSGASVMLESNSMYFSTKSLCLDSEFSLMVSHPYNQVLKGGFSTEDYS